MPVSAGLLPEANACCLAGMTRIAFARLLGKRQISVRYTSEDLDRDLQTLHGLK